MSLSEPDRYHPPTNVAKHLIEHAIRNIPNKQILLDKIRPPIRDPLAGLKPHEHNYSGKLQSVY